LVNDNFGKVYCGGYNEFGILQPDIFGKMRYKPLYIDSTKNMGQIQSMIFIYNKLFIATQKSLYVFNNNTVEQIYTDVEYLNISLVNYRLYMSCSKGLMLINLENEILFIDNFTSEIFSEKILKVIPNNNDLLIVSNKKIYLYQNNKLSDFDITISNIISKYGFGDIKILSDGTYALGTQKGGIFFFDVNGNKIHFLNKNTGLHDDRIYSLFIDSKDNLWATFSNGLAKIEIPSAFSYFDNNLGLRGKVNSILKHNDILYVATSNGLYFLNENTNNDINKNKGFLKINELNNNCYQLLSDKDILYIVCENALYSLIDNKITLIHKDECKFIIKSFNTNNLYYLATKNKILKLKHTSKHFYIEDESANINADISTIAEDSTKIWVGTYLNGIFSIDKNNFTSTSSIVHYDSGKGLPKQASWIEVYKTSKGILFSTYLGLYRFDVSLQKFYKDNHISQPNFYYKRRVHPIVEDLNNNIWFSYEIDDMYKKNISVAWNIIDDERYTVISNPFKKIENFVSETIFPDNNFVVWFGGFDGIVRMDFRKFHQDSLDSKTLIRQIKIGYDSILTYSTEFNNFYTTYNTDIDYKYNSIKFIFSTPIYENNFQVRHQYFLEGYDREWSQLSNSSMKEYTNLPPGEYCFKVRAQNIYGLLSKEAVFKFRIKKPFYTTWWAIIGYSAIFISFIYTLMRWRAYRYVKEKTKLERIITDRTEELLLEKEKTERLLSNILPERTVKELKDHGKATSMRFNMVTVLFSDIQGFTRIAEQMNPDVLVDELDKFFLQFDNVVEKCNIEKIKTIGDAYMCAGGIPRKNRTNPIEVVTAALEMQYYVKQMQKKAISEGSEYWGLRIGIHTGPVVAGVIGSKKYTYDIWGDTVNIASRMESSGEVGRINVSEDTYFLINQYFDCEYRGKMPVKYKGDIDMYFVNKFKVFFANNLIPAFPNTAFAEKLNLLKYEDLENYILDKQELELPDNIFYHDVKHTIDVVVHTEIFARKEGVSNEDLLLLKTAALFHDLGFIIGYRDHEMLGIQLANEILVKFNYNSTQIKIIGDLIYATRMPHNPKNLLEQIICDADLNYLGRSDYVSISRSLFQELITNNLIADDEYQWSQLQLKFLQNHRFFTETAKKMRNANKNKQLKLIIEENILLKEKNKK
jgi:adenylate cyclase